ncbi:MAG: T9SS type A sorting domain-containing protein [Candidatus Eisenbacteria bacterium]|uniref:T9SS type A sorting domain-containing protein n=1 Tax=Eiseniibacteriota bacterium TaxID=2212470 RepID=A0A948W5K1_UNCEI|nr:T9SS type A sorting domain-containing protein [Candidatus Eisenbacteria bacterium]MBU1950419.1 T9SS type A sorting domain-containing protein [Candidatus Eisenbacteria bacterium]MBU2690085.1 T9SS type A sorting domain-containing protein [Candidatus Eisenbacteria bacterium]
MYSLLSQSIFGRGLIWLSAALLLLVVAGGANSAWIPLDGFEGDGVDVQLLESSANRIVIDYTLPGFYADPVEINGATYYQITLPGESNSLAAGMPELPFICRSVIIPDQARMVARVLSIETEEFSGMPVIPSKGNLMRTVNPEDVPFEFDADYFANQLYPESPAGSDDPYILRDYRGMVVRAMPFQLNGSAGTLRVAHHLTIELVADGIDLTNSIDRDAPPDVVISGFAEIYQHHFLNYGWDRYTPVQEMGSMLIITYDAFHATMQPFVDWKNQQGIATTIIDVSTIGNTYTAIRNYIQNLYDAPGSDLGYVLLVGDGPQIASPSAAGGESDPTYSLLAGGDRYPEIFIGRFSAETAAQAQTQVDRTIAYEQTPMAGADWYHKGTGIASDQGPGDNGEYDNQHMDVIRGKLLNYGYSHVDQIYDPTGSAAQVSAALNEGRSIINYTGHGSETSWSSTGFSNTHVNALTNNWMLPFIISVACVNGDFAGMTCFAEAWMRATNGGTPTGAIATYMSTINQSWNPPMRGQDAAIDLLVNNEMFRMGGICFNGSCEMMDVYGASDGGDMFLTWTIFGDPSVLVRTKTPEVMTASHDGAMMIGLDQYAVTVPGVAGATCALYAGGVLYGAAITDGSGMATISLDPVPGEPMTLTLTVTASNKIPVIEDVEVLPPSGPFVICDGMNIDDTGGGDGDHICDAGETIDLTITLRNSGVENATDVTGELTTTDHYADIIVGSQSFGDVPAGGTSENSTPYQISLAGNTPDEHSINFTLMVHSNEGDWERAVNINVMAPMIRYLAQVVNDDPPLGNGSGWITPGEGFAVTLTLYNEGHADASDISVNLTGINPYIEALGGAATCTNIPAEGQAELTPLELRVLPGCPIPTVQNAFCAVQADYGYYGTFNVPVNVGGFSDQCEMDMGWTLGAADDDASAGLWIQADPIGTVYNGNTAQPEDDYSNPGTICFVTGNGSVGGAAGEADVDGGKTTLLTPVFDLAHVAAATFEYVVWYTNDLGNNPNQDYWDVQVTANGTDWVDLEHTMTSIDDWAARSFDLGSFITLSDAVQIRFVASDEGSGSLVEALIDNIVLTVTESSSDVGEAPIRLSFRMGDISPNPSNGKAQIRYAVPAQTVMDLSVYDISGRLIRTLIHGAVDPGEHQLNWDGRTNAGHAAGSGIYFLRMQAPGFTQIRQMAIVH